MRATILGKRLSYHQRERLIAHVAAPQLIDNQMDAHKCTTRQITASLIREGLVHRTLTIHDHGGIYLPIAPKFTILTEFGRQVAAVVLAEYAEQLVEAGCLDPDVMKEMKSPKLADDDVINWNRMRTLTRTEN